MKKKKTSIKYCRNKCEFYRLPRFACSSSMASNNDLKLPAPNPCGVKMNEHIRYKKQKSKHRDDVRSFNASYDHTSHTPISSIHLI